MTGIGKRIRAIRLRRGESLSEIARRSGISKGYLSQVETKAHKITFVKLLAICNVLEVSLEDVAPREIKANRILVNKAALKNLWDYKRERGLS